MSGFDTAHAGPSEILVSRKTSSPFLAAMASAIPVYFGAKVSQSVNESALDHFCRPNRLQPFSIAVCVLLGLLEIHESRAGHFLRAFERNNSVHAQEKAKETGEGNSPPSNLPTFLPNFTALPAPRWIARSMGWKGWKRCSMLSAS